MGAGTASQLEFSESYPPEIEVRTQLERILKSRVFEATARGREFLRYIVEETLAGRSNRIKAFTIAVEVFRRDASFDAQNDPVVRIEAGRLRRELERYYLLAGQCDPVFISIPKGGYIPIFTRPSINVERLVPDTAIRTEVPSHPETEGPRQRQKRLAFGFGFVALLAASAMLLQQVSAQFTSSSKAGSLPVVSTVIVLPFEALDRSPKATMLAKGLTDEVIGQLAKFRQIAVIVEKENSGVGSEHPSAAEPQTYRFEGRVRMDTKKLRLSARLVLEADGSVAWTDSYDINLNAPHSIDAETKVAQQVAFAIAQRTTFQAGKTETAHRPTSPGPGGS